MKIKALIFTIFLLGINSPLFSQKMDSNYGVNINLTYAIGTHLQRVGVSTVFFYCYKNFQISGRADYHFNKKNYGLPLQSNEFQLSIAALISYGEADSNLVNYSNYLQNHTQKRYSIAYSYKYYFDNIGTTQPSGAIFLQAKKFELISENDLFGKPSADKYRTATVKLIYRHENYSVALNSLMWTGITRGCPRIKNTDYPSRYGYKDLSKNKFGKFSNGILSFQFETYGNTIFYDNFRGDIGIDSEYIRHFFQNIIIHDMYIFPKKWNKAKNPHFPMLTETGEPYLFKKDQKVKKAKLHFVLYKNPTLFY